MQNQQFVVTIFLYQQKIYGKGFSLQVRSSMVSIMKVGARKVKHVVLKITETAVEFSYNSNALTVTTCIRHRTISNTTHETVAASL